MLRRLEEERPYFIKRIADFTPEQKVLAMTVFKKSVTDAEENLRNLLSQEPPSLTSRL